MGRGHPTGGSYGEKGIYIFKINKYEAGAAWKGEEAGRDTAGERGGFAGHWGGGTVHWGFGGGGAGEATRVGGELAGWEEGACKSQPSGGAEREKGERPLWWVEGGTRKRRRGRVCGGSDEGSPPPLGPTLPHSLPSPHPHPAPTPQLPEASSPAPLLTVCRFRRRGGGSSPGLGHGRAGWSPSRRGRVRYVRNRSGESGAGASAAAASAGPGPPHPDRQRGGRWGREGERKGAPRMRATRG